MSNPCINCVSRKVVREVLADINERKGYSQLWDEIDQEIKDELTDSLFGVVKRVLESEGFEGEDIARKVLGD